MNSSSLLRAPGPRYGNGKCSPDYNLFKDDRLIIKKVKKDLIRIMSLAVKSEVHVIDSFFNILNENEQPFLLSSLSHRGNISFLIRKNIPK